MTGIKEKMDGFLSEVKSLPFSTSMASSSKTTKQGEEGDKMKVKLMEKWNNFKYEMSEGTELRLNSPLWLLGKCYILERSDGAVVEAEDDKKEKLGKRQFLDDFASRPWFTYRKAFPAFSNTTLTSDTGWGCMIRTSQMMLCQGLFMHFLGRDWRWLLMQPQDLKQKELHRSIIKWFIDEPNERCPFSIHQLTEIGLTYRYKPGDWYGPSSMAYIMQDAIECGKGKNERLNNLVMYVAQDCAVYIEDIKNVCHWNIPSSNRSVIIFIPIRLGESVLNPIYVPCIQGLLTLTNCIGIVGGKPKHSLYFVGFQDEYLIYLDPHYSQVAHQLQSFSNKHLEAYCCTSPRKMHISKLDPSCCLGFYCADENDFEAFRSESSKYLLPPKLKTNCPLFLFADGSVRDYSKYLSMSEKGSSASSNSCATKEGVSQSCNTEVQHEISKTGSSKLDFDGNDDKVTVPETSKSDNKFSFSSTRQLITSLYRQQSRSPKSKRKNISLEEEFEML